MRSKFDSPPIVTKEAYAQFIVDQPSARNVHMGDSTCVHEGCAMIHYAQDQGWCVTAVGTRWFMDNKSKPSTIAILECSYAAFLPKGLARGSRTTYGVMQPRAQEYLDSL